MNSKLAFTALVIFTSNVAASQNSPALAQISGCGSGYSWYLTRVGSPIAANQFRVACNEHDACYDTFGKSKQECDKAFHNRMLDICYYTAVLEYGRDAYRSAQASAKRVGYFDNGTTVFYAFGGSYCGFVSPKHFDFFRQVNRAPSIGRQDPGQFGRDNGICTLPRGYFDDGRTVYYSLGNSAFCGFPNPPSLEAHRISRRQEPTFGKIDIDPSRLMSNLGICQ